MTTSNGTEAAASSSTTKIDPKPHSPVIIEPLTPSEVTDLLEADQDLWPQPITISQILLWHTLSFSWSWKYIVPFTNETAGLFFCIPLRRDAFQRLQKGQLKEHEIGEVDIWRDGDGDRGVGLHVFHVEKDTKEWRREWGRMMCKAFEDLEGVVKCKGAEVLGYSALAVTPDGFRAFKNGGYNLLQVEVSGCQPPVEGTEMGHSLLATHGMGMSTRDVEFLPSNGYWFFKKSQGNSMML